MKGKRILCTGILMIILFAVWTVLVQTVDVQRAGETGTAIGFATFNWWFHQLTGVHMWLYTVTDWLGLVPVFVCLMFAVMGFVQLVKRKSLWKVDGSIRLLGIYYIVVIAAYLVFERMAINYRPIFIEGRLEASYPSSTTLLVLSVMPTLVLQSQRRTKHVKAKHTICVLTLIYSLFMLIGRMLSGVHWLSDIIASVLLSAGLFCVYKASVILYGKEET